MRTTLTVGGDDVPFTDRQFWDRVTPSEGCWQWTGSVTPKGYGQMMARIPGAGGSRNSKTLQAHRMAWALLRGPIPDGLEIDHLCRNRGCVNPEHLELVTHAENLRRGAEARKQEAAA